MASIILNSYRRNFRSYSFFILALALALTVCSLGVSGIKLAASLWRYPYMQDFGGHIVIRNQREGRARVEYATTLLSRSQVEAIATDIFPEARLTATVEVPARFWSPADNKFFDGGDGLLVGRSGGLDTWYLLPPTNKGEHLGAKNLDQPVFVLRGRQLDDSANAAEIPIQVATYERQGGKETWQLVGALEQPVELIGTTGRPSYPGLWGHLSVVQELASLPTDRVNRIGIALPGLATPLDEQRVQQLRDRLAPELPGLEVVTVDDYGRLEQPAMLDMQAGATKYTPVVIGLALLLVAATALALVQSRRRELTLLQIIGMSKRRVWLLFAVECIFSAVLALMLTLLILIFGVSALFQAGALPLLPFVLSVLAAIGISLLVAREAVAKSIPSTLRSVS